MTGGGSIFLPEFNTRTNDPKVIEGEGFGKERRITHGFELHCSHTNHDGGPIEDVNNHIEINWGSPDQHFHLLFLTDITCPDDPNIIPENGGLGKAVGPDTLVGIGEGVYSGSFQGHHYSKEPAILTFILTDAGEPGTSDTSSYIITLKSSGIIVLNTGDAQRRRLPRYRRLQRACPFPDPADGPRARVRIPPYWHPGYPVPALYRQGQPSGRTPSSRISLPPR